MGYSIDDPQSFYNFVDLMTTNIFKFQITCHSIIDFPTMHKFTAVDMGHFSARMKQYACSTGKMGSSQQTGFPAQRPV